MATYNMEAYLLTIIQFSVPVVFYLASNKVERN